MSASSKIEWTDATWNPVTGCDHVSAGCDNCYAERIATRFGRPFIGAVECHPERLDLPLHWRKPRRVFVNSVSDLFHPDVPDQFIADVFDVMACHGPIARHTFQVLTKRPQRMAALLNRWADEEGYVGAPNVWLGVSVENQRYADLRIPYLLATPAAVRFLSVEPLLNAVSLTGWLNGGFGAVYPGAPDLDWVIVGGESGRGARPMDAAWARNLRDECVAAEVAFFFKQWGGLSAKANGRELDGRTWDEYPT